MPEHLHKRKHLTSFQLIILGFAGVILIGALILTLPVSSASGVVTPFDQALFTSTSAVCVTGLVVQDTGSYWSVFGQAVILALIQIGGLGVVTVAVSVFMLSGRKISLMQRSTMQDAISAPKVGGIVRLTKFILRGTFLIEALGAVLLLPVFCRDFGIKGIWMSVFHSISAFCNAGFDILGTTDHTFVSLTGYSRNIWLNIVIMLLIITGGIGFLTWEDFYINKFKFKRYRMQSKIILMTTAILICLPAIFFFTNDFKMFSGEERTLLSFFQSITTRTAGFNTADYTSLSSSGRGLTILLMFIGGSPGSTAGGIKTTTAAVLVANAFAVFRRQKSPEMFGRRMEEKAVHDAAAIFTLYLVLSLTGAFVISTVETLPLSECLFETTSAIATVGLSLGLTPHLGIVSQGILIFLMFIGRVGGLTMIYAALSGSKSSVARLPQERITVG